MAIASLGVRALGYLGLTWLVADTLWRAGRQLARGESRGARVGAGVCLVGTVAAAAIFAATIARESGALDRLLTLR